MRRRGLAPRIKGARPLSARIAIATSDLSSITALLPGRLSEWLSASVSLSLSFARSLCVFYLRAEVCVGCDSAW